MEKRGEKKEVMEETGIITGLIGVQFVYAGNSVLLSYLLSIGIDPLSLIVFSSFATFLILTPFSILFERKQWPKKFSFMLLVQLVLISFSGVTLFQALFLKGIKLTSPAMATAMPNLGPALIFLIAWAFRMEKVKMGCLYSRVKIMGTLLCVVGAVTMSIMQSANTNIHNNVTSSSSSVSNDYPSPPSDLDIFDKDKIIGCFYLMAAVFVLSSNVVLQAHTLSSFPAPITLCTVTSLIGALITALIQLVRDHHLQTGWPFISIRNLIGYSLLAGSVTGTCVSFNGWAMKKRGPVLVSVFNPVSTVISSVLSAITLHESINLGSLGGMCIMFTGLYFVLWAKGKEGFAPAKSIESGYDATKPLLS